MPINLSVNDGDQTPYLKYNAKAGRFYVKPRDATQDVEVMNPRLAFDMANIKTGWIFYQEGAGPEKVWDAGPGRTAARPQDGKKWKRGFEVMVVGNDNLPGVGPLGLREFSSTASNVIASILKMYDEYERGLVANPGKVPFFGCKRVIPVEGKYGTNYEPEFLLLGWVDRVKVPQLNGHDTVDQAGWEAREDDRLTTTTPRQPIPPPPLDDEIPF